MTATKMPNGQASARLTLLRDDDVQDLLRRRSKSLHARTRVAEAIRSLAIDICGGDEGLSATDHARLRQQLAAPINEATEEALRVLIVELAAALNAAPARMRPSIIAPLITRTDFE